MGVLWPKQAALYIYREGKKYRCDECIFQKSGATKCAAYGKSETIKPSASCNEWIIKPPNFHELPFFNGFTKIETGYTEDAVTCSNCEYFKKDKNDCRKVDKDSEGDTPGEINPAACCNRFDKDDTDEP